MAARPPPKKRARSSKQATPKVKGKEFSVANEPLTPYIAQFQTYREELESKHDKHERLVKLSRDCTIHSKRTIFLLHRITGEAEQNKVWEEAESKLQEAVECFRAIASELAGEDANKFHRAYSPGVQEFIEALSYLAYLKTGSLLSIEEAQDHLTFEGGTLSAGGVEQGDATQEGSKETDTGGEMAQQFVKVPLAPIDFVGGIADLTGELMRMAVNAIGSGSYDLPFELLPFVRAVYCAFCSLRPVSRDIPQKLNVLKNSLGKIEHVCYTLKIRGSEIPKQMLMDVITATSAGPGANED